MNPTSHLNDEQMYSLLDEAPNAEAQAHLLACVACQQEFSSLRGSLGNFRSAATSFAAAEGPSYAPRMNAVRSTAPRLAPRIWAGSLATAALLLAVSVSVFHPGTPGPETATNTAPQAPQVTVAPVSDEALLDGIQRDLSTSVPPSLEPLEVAAGSSDTSTQN
jgi:hypothetical protein